jgi:uncharacterized protein
MLERNELREVIDFAKRFHKENSNHDFGHVLRVVNVAKTLAKQENADLDVVVVAAYLHDIGYSVSNKETHNEASVELARPFLRRMKLSKDFIDQVLHAILHHRVSLAMKTDVIEAHVLCDADKIDMLGPYGFLRIVRNRLVYNKEDLDDAYHKAEETNRTLYGKLFTKSARNYIKNERDLMTRFCALFRSRDRLGRF